MHRLWLTISFIAFLFSEPGWSRAVGNNETATGPKTSVLDGRTFCRVIYLPHVVGHGINNNEAEHCVSFAEGKLIDNGNAIFGHPPERKSYVLNGEEIKVRTGFDRWERFPFSYIDGQLVEESGIVLTEKR